MLLYSIEPALLSEAFEILRLELVEVKSLGMRRLGMGGEIGDGGRGQSAGKGSCFTGEARWLERGVWEFLARMGPAVEVASRRGRVCFGCALVMSMAMARRVGLRVREKLLEATRDL